MNTRAIVYDSARRPASVFEEFVQAIRYRDLIKQLVRRDIVTRYKRSTLGVAWTMLNPLGMMLVLMLAFSTLFGSTRSYAVYVLSGLIMWNFFAQTTTAAMTQLAWGGALLNRIYLPRVTFALSSTGTGLINLLLSLIPLALVMVVTHTPLRPTVIVLPLAIAFGALFTLGVGLLVSTLAVYFHDVAEMYQIVLLGWMYLTPVIYPESIVPQVYRWWVFNLNPMYHLLKLFRLAIVTSSWPTPGDLAAAVGVATGAFVIGWTVFTGRADEFAYRV